MIEYSAANIILVDSKTCALKTDERLYGLWGSHCIVNFILYLAIICKALSVYYFPAHLGTKLSLMDIPSGVYTIENAHNRNWAVLLNDNDGDDVISGTDADDNAGHKVQ
jgi:hypothetical protein